MSLNHGLSTPGVNKIYDFPIFTQYSFHFRSGSSVRVSVSSVFTIALG
jgi:hypothetical protein